MFALSEAYEAHIGLNLTRESCNSQAWIRLELGPGFFTVPWLIWRQIDLTV